MNHNPVIHVENLSKSYDVYQKPQDYIREMITRKTRHDVFWALRNVSFDVFEKQRVGIIGPNGAGKSTLLKILTGNLAPTSGAIQVNGKVSALLSMASSLNPEESGLENIKFNLLLQGTPKSQIEALTEEIIDFAELGSFIYSPVKTYSSGMNAKLAFGISTAVAPEILVVDEVLSVGDGYFLNKAHKRMMELVERGKALIFVSHSINEVRRLCNHAIWLENGSVREAGNANEVCDHYEQDYTVKTFESTRQGNIADRLLRSKYAAPEQLLSPDLLYFRLVANNAKRSFTDTHYIRKISVVLQSEKYIDIDLSVGEMNRGLSVAWVDIFGSEWGRLYNRLGSDSRVLSSRTGRNWGGQMLLNKNSVGTAAEILEAHWVIETSSTLNREELTLEYLDPASGEWLPAQSVSTENMDSNWMKLLADVKFPIVGEEHHLQVLKDIVKKTQVEVELVKTVLLVDGKESVIVYEKQPFQIDVHIHANIPVPRFSVIVEINRADGLYMFEQSSALDADNYENLLGDAVISFLFDNNYFSEGDYAVMVSCDDGFDENDIFGSKILMYTINALRFSVKRVFPFIHMGVINQRVPVKVSYL